MNIVFVTSTLHAGGSERVMALLANAFCLRQHHVEIICLNKHVVFYPIQDDVKLLFAKEEVGSESICPKLLWMRNYIRKERPDVVIAFMLEVYCATLFSLIGLHIPVITSDRISPQFFSSYKRCLRWLLLRFTSHHVVQTKRIFSTCPNNVKVKTTIIPNPVTNDVFHENVKEKKDIIIAVGRLAFQKNYPMMFRGFKNIAEAFPQYHLYVYGEGPLRKELENVIDNLGMKGKIVLAGKTDSIIDKLEESKLFCMTSDFEGMSNAMLEAVCVGLPVLTTDVSGASDLIEHGKDGFIISIGDEEKFAAYLLQLLSDERMMQKMGERNKNKAVKFKEERIVEQWEQVIYGVIS